MKITKRGGSWQASVIHDGKRIRRSFKNEQDAKVWAAESELAMARGQPVPEVSSGVPMSSGRTLRELYRVTHETRWSACWGDSMTKLGQYIVGEVGGDTLVTDITFPKIASWISDLKAKGLTQATINRRLAALSTMFTTAVNMGWVSEKPKLPFGKEKKKERRFLTHDEEEAILSRLEGTPEWGLVVVAADTGLRLSELLNLKWRSVRSDFITVEKSKNGNPRTVPLTKRAREVLSGIPRDSSGPFAKINNFECSRRFKRAAREAGILDDAVVFHSLRHTCASRLVMSGVDVMRVKAWMGHRCITTTMIYAHLAPDSLSDVVARLEEHSGGILRCAGRVTSCVKMTQLEAS